jgi:N-glycosylase/DNA lyase
MDRGESAGPEVTPVADYRPSRVKYAYAVAGSGMASEAKIAEWYDLKKPEIQGRLAEFRALRDAADERWFSELAFCVTTADGTAEQGIAAQKALERTGALLTGDENEIKRCIASVRYNENKARFIFENRRNLSEGGRLRLRSRLVDDWGLTDATQVAVRNDVSRDKLHFKGLGQKEASHFLRNVGYGSRLAILDVHVLTLMRELSLLPQRFIATDLAVKRPGNLEQYRELERLLEDWSSRIGIPMDALDLALWSFRTGRVLK